MEQNYYQKVYRLTIVGLILVCAVLLMLRVFGYGHLSIQAPAGATVKVNGQVVTQHSLKLRPGSYDVEVRTAQYFTAYQSVKVSLLQTATYNPRLTDRTPSSVINASSASLQGLSASNPAWLEDHTWLVAITGRGGATVVATHYQNGRWSVAYGADDLRDTSKLPAEIVSAINAATEDLRAYN